MKLLKITVSHSFDSGHDYGFRASEIYRRYLNVEIKFAVHEYGKKSHQGLIVQMRANYNGHEDDCLRESLLRSKSVEWFYEVWDERDDIDPIHLDEDSHNTIVMGRYLTEVEDGERKVVDEYTIHIIDPDGILKWLGLDAMDIYKQQQTPNTALNDKPLQLPSTHHD